MKFKYSKEMLQYLEREYKTYRLPILTIRFNKDFKVNQPQSSVRACIKNHKMKCGRSGCFKKGEAPWNAGTKGLTSANKTSFKKGSTPANSNPIGHERICSKDGYVLIKIAEPNPYTGAKTRYKAKHIVVWEKHNGKVPPGHIITFIDNNVLNNNINNLDCISKAVNVRRNHLQYRKYSPEIQPTVIALAKLKTKTHSVLQRD